MIRKKIMVAGLAASTALGATLTGMFPVIAEEVDIKVNDQKIEISNMMEKSDSYSFGGNFIEKLQNLEKLRMLTKSNVENLQKFLGLTETELVTKLEKDLSIKEIAEQKNISEVDLLDFTANSISDMSNQVFKLGYIDSEMQDYAATNSMEIAATIIEIKPSELENLNETESMVMKQIINHLGVNIITPDQVEDFDTTTDHNYTGFGKFRELLEGMNLDVEEKKSDSNTDTLDKEIEIQEDRTLFSRFWDFIEGLR